MKKIYTMLMIVLLSVPAFAQTTRTSTNRMAAARIELYYLANIDADEQDVGSWYSGEYTPDKSAIIWSLNWIGAYPTEAYLNGASGSNFDAVRKLRSARLDEWDENLKVYAINDIRRKEAAAAKLSSDIATVRSQIAGGAIDTFPKVTIALGGVLDAMEFYLIVTSTNTPPALTQQQRDKYRAILERD